MRRDCLHLRLLPVAAALAVLTGCCHSYPRVVWSQPAACEPAAVYAPPPQPMAQTSYVEPSNGYLKQGPVVTGTVLAQPAQKPASEVAVELRQQNETLQSEKKQLDERVAKLAKDLELNHQALTQANGEMEKAQKDLTATKMELQAWQHQLATLYSGFRTSEQQQTKTLQDMEQELQRIIQVQQKKMEAAQQTEEEPADKAPPLLKAPSEKSESVNNATPAADDKAKTASAPALPKS